MKNLKVGDKVKDKQGNILTVLKVDKEDNTVFIGIDDPALGSWAHVDTLELILKPTHPLPPAVLVQNEREHKLLMNNFNERRWDIELSYNSIYTVYTVDKIWEKFQCHEHICTHLNIIPFSTYALIAGIALSIETTLDEGATVTLSENRFEFDESVMSLSLNDVRNLYNLIKDHMY